MDSRQTHTILIVDDDVHLRESLSEVLAQEGYAALAAADGRTALDYLQTRARPSLIILDLLMPVMDGWEFRSRQRELEGVSGIPILITTALSASYRQENRLGATAYFTKPLDVPHLLEVISEICASQEHLPERPSNGD